MVDVELITRSEEDDEEVEEEEEEEGGEAGARGSSENPAKQPRHAEPPAAAPVRAVPPAPMAMVLLRAALAGAAFKDMLEDIREAGEPIVSIESDDGGEFKGAFQRVLDAEGISHLTYPSTSASDTALSKVERVNLTLRKFLNNTK